MGACSCASITVVAAAVAGVAIDETMSLYYNTAASCSGELSAVRSLTLTSHRRGGGSASCKASFLLLVSLDSD